MAWFTKDNAEHRLNNTWSTGWVVFEPNHGFAQSLPKSTEKEAWNAAIQKAWVFGDMPCRHDLAERGYVALRVECRFSIEKPKEATQ